MVSLPRGTLLALAREALVRQASAIYAPEALTVVEEIFVRNTEVMPAEQLAHIVVHSEAA